MGSVFDLFAKLTLDSSEYERGLDNSKSKLSAIGGKISEFAGKAVKVTAAAVAAGAGVVTAITKQAIDSYANYEQLVGGVETLFGDSAQKVIDNAGKAFQTAGMSANEYMETVTGFSASLLQSLGGDTKAATDMADLAVRDMSDNANKMGTDMGRITDAYQGFAKQNYTMLDNLKLGYGGTKTEMERLVADAERLDSSFQATRDENGKLTLSFADVVEAIHVVQTNMGITGTTALEASTTISGSINSMKAAWRNLITGIADENANFGQLVDNFITTLVGDGSGQGGVINNLIPRIQQTLAGVTKLVTAASEQLLPIVVSTIITNLPALIQAGLQIVTTLTGAIIDNLPALIDAAIQIIQMITTTIATPENLFKLIDAGLQIILSLADALIDALPQIIPAVIEIVLAIVEKLTEPGTLVQLIDAALRIAIAIGEGLIRAIPEIVKAIPQIIANIAESILAGREKIRETGKELLSRAKDGFSQALPGLVEKANEAAEKVRETIRKNWEVAKAIGNLLIVSINAGIAEKVSQLNETINKVTTNISDSLKRFGEKAKTFGSNIIQSIRSGIADRVSDITAQIQSLKDSISRIFQNLADAAASWGRDLIGNFVSGLQDKLQALRDKAVAIAQQIKDVIGFSEPKEGPLSNFHTYAPDMMELFARGIRDNENLITDAISSSFNLGDQIGAGFNQGRVVGVGNSQPVSGGVRNMTTILQLDRTELGRIVYQLYNEESQRVGVKLAAGGIA